MNEPPIKPTPIRGNVGEKGGSVHGLNPIQVEKLILIRYGGRLKVVIKVSDGLFYGRIFMI